MIVAHSVLMRFDATRRPERSCEIGYQLSVLLQTLALLSHLTQRRRRSLRLTPCANVVKHCRYNLLLQLYFAR